jgi:hypothetical protein
MSEPFEATQPELTPFDLLRPPQEPIVFPNFLRGDRRWQQLPPGDIVYINATKPDELPERVTMLDQQGHPIKRHGHNWERPIEEPSRVPAVVIHTGKRTPEQSYEDVIEEATKKLTRRVHRDTVGGIVEQNLGFVVIVEDKGEDTRVGWRQEQLTRHGLVKDKEGDEKVVIVTDNNIITLGRIEKKVGTVNIAKSPKAGYHARSASDRIKRMKSAGLIVDSSELTKDAEASSFPPRTIDNLKDLNGVTITDPLSGCSFERDLRGLTTFHHVCENPEEHKIELPKNPEQVKQVLLNTYREGGLRQQIELEECCGDCGQHLKLEYYPSDWVKPGETIQLLKRRKVCDSKLHRGMPGSIIIGKPETIGRLSWHKTS